MNSKERRREARAALGKTANTLIDEMWDGKWDHIRNWRHVPIGTWPEILRELGERCPGHTREEYEESLRRSMITRR